MTSFQTDVILRNAESAYIIDETATYKLILNPFDEMSTTHSIIALLLQIGFTILCLKWHNNSIYDLDEITITKNNENELEIIKYEFEMMKQVYFEKLKGLNTDKKDNEQEEKQQELKQDDDDDIDDDEDDVDIEQMYDKPATFETDTTGLMGE